MSDLTYGELLEEMTVELTLALGDDGTRRAEASILLMACSALDKAQLITRMNDSAPVHLIADMKAAMERRKSGEPVYRIIGKREFHGLMYKLSHGTLEPRDDTETLVELVLEEISDRQAPLRFADLGTGTGAIGLALLSELPAATCLATDLSSDALDTALKNAQCNGLEGRFTTALGSWCEPLSGVYDFIVSNPPYIASNVVDGLATEVLNHDPRLALDGGDDGLEAYRSILRCAGDYLAAGGFLALEIGYDQRESLAELAVAQGWLMARCQQDLGNRDRAVLLRRGLDKIL